MQSIQVLILVPYFNTLYLNVNCHSCSIISIALLLLLHVNLLQSKLIYVLIAFIGNVMVVRRALNLWPNWAESAVPLSHLQTSKTGAVRD